MFKPTRLGVLSLVAVLLFASVVQPAAALSEAEQQRLDLIRSSCSSIKLQLYKTQKSDSKTRVRIGAYYETISTKMMMNLNLRLVKNNIAATSLATEQSDFSVKSEEFKRDFIKYSQELEGLIAIDCAKRPEDFSKKLDKVRKKRARLSQSVDELNVLIDEHRESVAALKEDLFGAQEIENE